jgi:DNA-binding LacI/PurR family transcriptional regulator
MAVRQRDVARAAGVSQAAVSLVVSGRAAEGGVSSSTQERIRAVMKDLGYVPNTAARSLRGGRNGLIGVHTYEPVFPADPDDYFREFLVGIEVAAAELGQDLLLFSSAQQAGPRRSIYGPQGTRVKLADGAIILGMQRDVSELARLAAEKYPFVVLGTFEEVPQAAWVGIDYPSALQKIVHDLHENDHHTFVYVRGGSEGAPFRDRRRAFVEATLGDRVTMAETADLDPDTLAQWVTDGATALVTEDVAQAEVVADLARRADLRIPQDLSTVVLNDTPDTGPVSRWSHLRIPKQQAGKRTVTVLTEILDGTLPRDHHELLSCLPHDRSTITRARP